MSCALCGDDQPLFLRIPTNPATRSEWKQLLKTSTLPATGRICFNHFKNENAKDTDTEASDHAHQTLHSSPMREQSPTVKRIRKVTQSTVKKKRLASPRPVRKSIANPKRVSSQSTRVENVPTHFKISTICCSVGSQTDANKEFSPIRKRGVLHENFLSNMPVSYIQAIRFGRNKQQATMKFKSTITRSTQTCIKDLLPISEQLMEAIPDKTDIGRYVPVNILIPQDIETVTEENKQKLAEFEVQKLNKKLAKRNTSLKNALRRLERITIQLALAKQILDDQTKEENDDANLTGNSGTGSKAKPNIVIQENIVLVQPSLNTNNGLSFTAYYPDNFQIEPDASS